MRIHSISSVVLVALLTGCATTPPVTGDARMCAFKQQALIVHDPRGSSGVSRPADAGAAVPGPSLILSGGSQNGAFGAGFLKRWAELSPGGRLPEFELVTGISTGAILSTWAFIGEPETVAAEYRINHEKQLLNVYRKPSKNGKIGFAAALTLIRKNSLADLEPLRKRLRDVIDFDTLAKVARQPGRLKIAAVEIDTGNAILFDMKDMAARATSFAATSAEFEHYRDCYADAVLASSSVPLAAKPVFIDNRMYIDGGARYGVFVDYLSNAAPPPPESGGGAAGDPIVPPSSAAEPAADRPDAPRLFILINGTQWVKADCGKIDASLCGNELDFVPDPVENRKGARKPWDIAGLAFRSNDILINQVYRLSAARVQAQYQLKYPRHAYRQHFYFSRMHRTDLWHEDKFSFEGKSCRQWHDADKAKLRPLEFYPNYMRCLQAYGANQAEELKWYLQDAESNFENYQAL